MPLFGSMNSEETTSDNPSTVTQTPSTPTQTNAPGTVIAKGVRLEGEFKSQGDVQIEGEVVGTIQTDALLTIGPDAVVKAGVTAKQAEIAGKVEGNVTVKDRLMVKSTANLKGDMTCGTLSVESGATLSGQLSCGEKTSSPSASGSSSSSTDSGSASKPNSTTTPSSPATPGAKT